jgi:putative transposase
MARPLRIEIPAALYHVTSRGDRREAIYVADADRRYWLKLLGEVCERFNWQCHAYCLMDNHYHIILETIEGNLSAGMRQLNGVYTQWHNRTHGKVGHVFQGRFKAIIVQREAYLLELARYVVLNPVRAGICAMPQDWPWSSYAAMIEADPSKMPPKWLNRAWLLQQFDPSAPQARAAYIDHVRAGIGLPSIWERLQDQIILGDAKFAAIVSGQVMSKDASEQEIPRLQRRAAAAPLSHFKALPERNTAIASAFQTGCYSLKDIGQAFGLHYATVSRIIKAQESENRDEDKEHSL